MQVVVTGATGNVGSAVLEALARDPAVEAIVGVARRIPAFTPDKVRWHGADVRTADLEPIVAGADAVVHLAWAIQPSRDAATLRDINVKGSVRVFEAAARTGVKTLVYASSVGAYGQGPKDRRVDESWPTDGIDSLFYSRHKAEIESFLDRFERRHEAMRVVRLRPGLIFRAEAAVGIRRLFLGPLFPGWLAAPGRIPVVPDIDDLRFQAVHTADVAEAYRLALHRPMAGAFNIAAEPVIGPSELCGVLRARRARVPVAALRAAADVAWRLRLQPSPAGWLDLGLGVPVMSVDRARSELGWEPRASSLEALADLLAGLRTGRGFPTPPLAPSPSGAARWREFATGVGSH